MKNFKFIAKLSIILFLIAFVCSLILVLCNTLTKDKIASLQSKTETQAQMQVLPNTKSFEKADKSLIDDDAVLSALIGLDKDGKQTGYCFKVVTSGFGGKISMIIGIDKNQNICGVKITDMSETPGLGAKADDNWLKQYTGKSGELSVIKSGEAKDSEVNAISGATITSKAVTKGVNSAIEAAKKLNEKEDN